MTKYKDLVINTNPKSMFAEAIKNVRTNLTFLNVSNDMKVMIVTSPEPGDGKSFITANMAIAYEQENKKVLIIDCDLRKGRQHEIFNINNISTKGYSNLILNYKKDINYDDYIVKTFNDNIDLIPTGPTPPNPIELLSTRNNEKIIEELKKRYDIILLDCPPILGLSDSLVLTKFSDANVIVISNKKTKVEVLSKTKKMFETANAKITGVIINKASVKDNHYYSYYANDYYTKKG